MPPPGMMWRHVIISTRRSWLHGDARGFRSREHRIHSSGDYRNPPPPGEHAGLLHYHQRRAKGEAIRIPKPLRKEVLRVLLRAIRKSGHRVLVIAVKAKHAHALVELPKDRTHVKRIVGKWKCARSKPIRAHLKGSIWAEGGKYKPVRTRSHQLSAYKYIRDDQGPGARVWTCREGLLPPTRRTES
ncbi:MAG TPA: hypothetical protein VFB66_09555 [Tepidisphaeraceae bacterium]|nr:hypothetical protein [Tepidisphaeraceae bacterium]